MLITLQINNVADLPTTSIFVLKLTSIHQFSLPSCVTTSLKRLRAVQEYLACFPSSTPIGLDLGAD